jgi:hypothetical protein
MGLTGLMGLIGRFNIERGGLIGRFNTHTYTYIPPAASAWSSPHHNMYHNNRHNYTD